MIEGFLISQECIMTGDGGEIWNLGMLLLDWKSLSGQDGVSREFGL